MRPDPDPSELATCPEYHCRKLRLTQAQAVECVRWWAEKLTLLHWAIDVRVAPHREMKSMHGHLSYNPKRLRASIMVVDADDIDPDADPCDMEQSIVHEMVHLFLAHNDYWISNDSRTTMGEVDEAVVTEAPVDRLAFILVTMRRADEKSRMSWELEREVEFPVSP